MNTTLRREADCLIQAALEAVQPDQLVRQALHDFRPGKGKLILLSIGKAAWTMARAALSVLEKPDHGLLITKYGHLPEPLPELECIEAGHPLPDENSLRAGEKVWHLVQHLKARDRVVLLLSGGGSALMEKSELPLEELISINEQLLRCGADIQEINTIRKRLSALKGGRLGLACGPAPVYSVLLSDVPGDAPDLIASGPALPDPSTVAEAVAVAEKYKLHLSDAARNLLKKETPKDLPHATYALGGSPMDLCRGAAREAERLGYQAQIWPERLSGSARDTGVWLANRAREAAKLGRPVAIIAGGETTVEVRGNGLGGRNQELALAAAPGLEGLKACIFSLGSDGSDGPTPAAGGYVDGDSMAAFRGRQLDVAAYLKNNDSYHALQAVEGLIITGPTGTNVNDLSVALVRG